MKNLQTTTLKNFLKQLQKTPNSTYDISNIFSVVKKGKNSYFNLAKTINFNNVDQMSQQYYTLYKIQEGDTWTNISYQVYGNIKAWWIICKFNNVKNPFTDLIVGKTIKLPTMELLKQISQLLIS